MYQEFTVTSSPETGAGRLADLRVVMKEMDVQGFLIPRADAHQGENVAECSERLRWLTGFTGSAGFCAALLDKAGVFIDGRYTLQVRSQIDLDHFTPVSIPTVKLGDWLVENQKGGTIAYDPWLHGFDEIEALEKKLNASGIELRKTENLVDKIWADRPDAPQGRVVAHDLSLAGESSESKRQRIAEIVEKAGQVASVLTLPDSIAWLLNIRGSDVANTPVALCFAVLHKDASVDLFIDVAKCDAELRAHLGDQIRIYPEVDLLQTLSKITGKVGVDRQSAPVIISDSLQSPVWGTDPCVLPKARKNTAEIAGTKVAHIRDGAAMVEFLCWLDSEAPKGNLTEIDVVTKLEGFRRQTNALMDISFETISGAGPNGAIVHYRVDENSNRTINSGDILLVDSGGQYVDGTTDITRTIPVGPVDPVAARANTLVLKGMIAISRARWPDGLAGKDLDTLARVALWQAGMDYDHGTGHGVGAYLGVHEGPQRISRMSDTALETGMILSNEPGYYKEGAFGIRIENLVVVEQTSVPEGGDRAMRSFETITYVPIDKRLIVAEMLDSAERDWLDKYHTEVFEKLADLVSDVAKPWLKEACQPI